MKEYLESTNHFVIITTSMNNGIKISSVASSVAKLGLKINLQSLTKIEFMYCFFPTICVYY